MKRKELGAGLRIKAAMAHLDETATSYERKWCLGRLRFYVDAAKGGAAGDCAKL